MFLMADCSAPITALPPGYRVIAGYLGGDTPHTWAPIEWRRFGPHRKLPIWVRSLDGTASGTDDAWTALRRLYTLNVPKGNAVACDMEAQVDMLYLHEFWSILRWAGYRVWTYGSTSSLFENPQCDGYWVAAPGSGQRHYQHSGEVATQFRFGPQYDSSCVRWWAYYRALKVW